MTIQQNRLSLADPAYCEKYRALSGMIKSADNDHMDAVVSVENLETERAEWFETANFYIDLAAKVFKLADDLLA